MVKTPGLLAFARESNQIENIHSDLQDQVHAEALQTFLAVERITVEALVQFVSAVQPDARLRMAGDRVRVGNHFPPDGDVAQEALARLLRTIEPAGEITPFEVHVEYERIHPFADGNGRSGRAIWLWMMDQRGWQHRLSFLHQFYYQTLAAR